MPSTSSLRASVNLDAWCAPSPPAGAAEPLPESSGSPAPVPPSHSAVPAQDILPPLEPAPIPAGAIKGPNGSLAIPIEPINLGAFVVLHQFIPVKFIRRPWKRSEAGTAWISKEIDRDLWHAFRSMPAAEFIAAHLA